MTTMLAAPDITTAVALPAPGRFYRPNVGDVFVTSWGYDQTNVNAYLVVEVTPSGKSVRTKPAAMICVKDSGPRTDVRPTFKVSTDGYDVLDYSGERWERGTECPVAKLHRVKSGYQGAPCIRVGDHIASLWDGHRSYYQTGCGWGH